MADVFLSHGSADRNAAVRLDQALVEAGLSVWWDHKLVSGERFQQTIVAELNRAAAVVVVWSPSSVKSDWVYSEASRAREQRKLIQVRTGDLDGNDLPAPFDAFHCPHIDDIGAVVQAARALLSARGSPGAATPQVDAASAPTVAGNSPVRPLPSGTVTILVAQIEASADALIRPTDADIEGIDATRSILRDTWRDHVGIDYDSQGERVYVAFATAADGVAAAGAAQRRIEERMESGAVLPRVRIGLHSGSPRLHAGGYVGLDVQRAALIAAAANGGQTVLSTTTRDLVADRLPDGASVSDLGAHRLKDLPQPEHLFQLVTPGLRSSFPVLKSLGTATNLPVPAGPLVGRERELEELVALLSTAARLVTLTGPGGSGKTRLAVSLADRTTASFPDGVYYVPLAAVTSAAVMWSTISETLGVPPEGRIPPGLFTYVAQRSALLVLDNLEQLSDANQVVAELLQQAPQIVVLATSRRPLHLAHEREFPVHPLELPGETGNASVSASAAVQLFVQEAQRVRPDFTLSEENAADVAAICRQLDGLPLAVELAAARTKLLSPRALLARLDQSLDFATLDSQATPRHQTLRETITWSYDLLNAQQQQFFGRLGVFAGGADLEALAEVAGVAGGATTSGGVLDLVAELVDASLVVVTEASDGEPRFALLETLRAYAHDLLAADDELVSTRQRHAEHYLRKVEELKDQLDGSQYVEARWRFEVEHENLREALDWSLQPRPAEARHGEVLVGLRICVAAYPFWRSSGYFAEERRWLERAVECAGGVDGPALARSLQALAASLRIAGDLVGSRSRAAESVAMWRRLDEKPGLAIALVALAITEAELGNSAAARPLFEEAGSLARKSGNKSQLVNVLSYSSTLESDEGNYQRSLELDQEALTIAGALGDPAEVLNLRHNLACTLRALGRLDEAQSTMLEVIPEALRLNLPGDLVYLAEDQAALLAELGDHAGAVRLLGAADATRERLAIPRSSVQEAEIAGPMAKARAALTAAQWDDAYGEGRTTTVEGALSATLDKAAVDS